MPLNLKAREIFDSAALGPEALKVIGQAFDEAWACIAGNDESPTTVEAARLILAKAILAVETLKNAALQAMALAYRRRYEQANAPTAFQGFN